jgi:uncharacterized protein YfiM (DUF2279 family)
MIKILFCKIALFIIGISPVYAQYADSLNSFSKRRFNIAIISSSAAYVGTMATLNHAWYSTGDRESFHLFNDAGEWKQVDKVGHFYSAFQLSSIGSQVFRWTGISKQKSNLIGSTVSLAMISSVEIFDGFSTSYGASFSDLGANLAGSAFYLGQQKLWREIRIYPKYSFHQTNLSALRPAVLGNGFMEELLKDYNGQTYWLSIDINKFFKFPKWINLAFGYGMQNMIYATRSANKFNGFSPTRQYYLSIDFDLTAIKSHSKALNSLIYFLNMIKIPAPALEFSDRKIKMHALYF